MTEYNISEAFRKIENELIDSMIRNMDRHRAEEDKESILWSQWQAEQLQCLERYKLENQKKYGTKFKSLNHQVEVLIETARETGNMEQEIEILEAIKNGFTGCKKIPETMQSEFFRINDRKLDALIRATMDDLKTAETAVLRMANDQYRKAIFNAQVYANTGAGTYAKAVDMATKDMLAAGLNCVEYKNGARHRLNEYADMAIKTASKRAYLTGEGEMRQKWSITTVIVNKRGNPCPKCLPFCGKVLIDDVWSGGKKEDAPYPLMSTAIAAGLYHPRCKDIHTTYFPGISTANDTWTKKELEEIGQQSKEEARQQYAERQAEKFERLEKYSLDPENKEKYHRKAKEWKKQVESGTVLTDSTDKWLYRYKKELIADEKVLSKRQIETAAVYNSKGEFLFQRRGTEKEVIFSLNEFKRLKGNIVTHNHPSGGSFSSADIWLLKKSKAAELRVITEKGVYFLRPPSKWEKDINSLDKIKSKRREIQKEIAKKYQRLYNISDEQRYRLASDEIMRIFAERYGMEYGWEAFEN